MTTKLDFNNKRIIIAKTSHIGDVVISLPMAAVIKQHYPQAHLIFLANKATCQIAQLYPAVDEVCDWGAINKDGKTAAIDALKKLQADVFIHLNPSSYVCGVVKKAGIPIRVGNFFRWYQWFTCNRLVSISFPSVGFNKRQLDLRYLTALGIKDKFSYADLTTLYRFNLNELPSSVTQLLAPNKFKLILHPTLITAQNYQWPLDYYAQLIELLPPDKFQIFISGIDSDRDLVQQPLLDAFPHVIDLVGKLKLNEFMSFMQQCDGLIAGSTGPLHLAAALGIHALGIYRPDKTYIKRWEPVGAKAEVISHVACKSCPNGNPCTCITAITPQMVKQRIEQWASAELLPSSGAARHLLPEGEGD